MSEAHGERLTRVEDRLDALRSHFDSHLREAKERSDRVREVEQAVLLLVEAQKEARRQEATQYRRLEVTIQRLAVAITFAGLVVAIVSVVVNVLLR